jgi:hypothetical protein
MGFVTRILKCFSWILIVSTGTEGFSRIDNNKAKVMP